MKRSEVILRRHNQQMLTHFKLLEKDRVPEENLKIFNETIKELDGYINQEIEAKKKIELIKLLTWKYNGGASDLFILSEVDEYLTRHEKTTTAPSNTLVR